MQPYFSWESVQCASKECRKHFLCLSDHRSNQWSTSLILSSYNWKFSKKVFYFFLLRFSIHSTGHVYIRYKDAHAQNRLCEDSRQIKVVSANHGLIPGLTGMIPPPVRVCRSDLRVAGSVAQWGPGAEAGLGARSARLQARVHVRRLRVVSD